MTDLRPHFQEYRAAGALHQLVALESAIDDHILATKRGDLLLILSMKGVDPECLEPEQIEDISRAFQTAIRPLDEHFRIYQYLHKRPLGTLSAEPHENPVIQEAIQNRLRHLISRPAGLYDIDAFLVIAYENWHPVQSPKARGSGLARLIASFRQGLAINGTTQAYSDALDEARKVLISRSQNIVAQLRDRVGLRVLDRHEAFRFLRRLLNYSPSVSEPLNLVSNEFLDRQLCSSHLECHQDYLRLQDQCVSVLTLKEPPPQTFPMMLRALADLPCSFILAAEWRREETAKIRGLIQSKRRHFHQAKTSLTSQLSASGPSGASDALINTGAVAIADDLGASLQEIDALGQQFGEYSMTLVVHDENPNHLRKAVAQSLKTFAALDAHLIEERYNRLNAWLSILPGNGALNLRRIWLSETNAADLALLMVPYRGTERNSHLHAESIALLETGSDTPYCLNLHYQDVAHTFIQGTTGSGKSFLLNFLLTHLQKYDPATIVFDLGGSYENLAKLLSGSYLALRAERREFQINPFCLPLSAENQRFLLSWARVLVESDGYRMPAEAELDLFDQIQNLYQLAPDQRRLSTLAQIAHPDLRPRLQKWTQAGPYGNLFDHAHDTLTFARFQAFDFEGMENMKEQLEPLLFYVLHRASEMIDENPWQFKVFVMDEAWRFFSHPAIKGYMKEGLKTWRKKNAALILATQSSDDLRGSDMLSVIVESCPTHIFLANPRVDPELYREAFHLNRTEAERIAALVPKEQMLIKQPDHSKVVRLTVDPKEYWIYTSHPQERERRREAFARYGFRAGLDYLVNTPPGADRADQTPSIKETRHDL